MATDARVGIPVPKIGTLEILAYIYAIFGLHLGHFSEMECEPSWYLTYWVTSANG